MKKLQLDDLAVESFATADEDGESRGTVRAHSGGDNTYCIATCGHCESFFECSETCGPHTCSGSYDYTFCGEDTCLGC